MSIMCLNVSKVVTKFLVLVCTDCCRIMLYLMFLR